MCRASLPWRLGEVERLRSVHWLVELVAIQGPAPEEAPRTARERILAIVARVPGLHLRALQRESGSGWGSLAHHLHILVRGGQIRLAPSGKHVHVYPVGAAPSAEVTLYAHGAARLIFEALPTTGATQAELARGLSLTRQLVAYHLARLMDLGLVEIVQDRPKVYARSRRA